MNSSRRSSGLMPTPEEREAHEEALWNWYLEWSEIARTVIHDRQLLRAMGFLQPVRTRVVSADGDDVIEGEFDEDLDEVESLVLDGLRECNPDAARPSSVSALAGE